MDFKYNPWRLIMVLVFILSMLLLAPMLAEAQNFERFDDKVGFWDMWRVEFHQHGPNGRNGEETHPTLSYISDEAQCIVYEHYNENGVTLRADRADGWKGKHLIEIIIVGLGSRGNLIFEPRHHTVESIEPLRTLPVLEPDVPELFVEQCLAHVHLLPKKVQEMFLGVYGVGAKSEPSLKHTYGKQ